MPRVSEWNDYPNVEDDLPFQNLSPFPPDYKASPHSLGWVSTYSTGGVSPHSPGGDSPFSPGTTSPHNPRRASRKPSGRSSPYSVGGASHHSSGRVSQHSKTSRLSGTSQLSGTSKSSQVSRVSRTWPYRQFPTQTLRGAGPLAAPGFMFPASQYYLPALYSASRDVSVDDGVSDHTAKKVKTHQDVFHLPGPTTHGCLVAACTCFVVTFIVLIFVAVFFGHST
ncbi:uncharacterized protein LOC121389483 isoform X2 [Gigantopelta aegis]|nr:uncharacterized protein LOC121389483 isoform X2 [Gigantopelta aegis]